MSDMDDEADPSQVLESLCETTRYKNGAQLLKDINFRNAFTALVSDVSGCPLNDKSITYDEMSNERPDLLKAFLAAYFGYKTNYTNTIDALFAARDKNLLINDLRNRVETALKNGVEGKVLIEAATSLNALIDQHSLTLPPPKNSLSID